MRTLRALEEDMKKRARLRKNELIRTLESGPPKARAPSQHQRQQQEK